MLLMQTYSTREARIADPRPAGARHATKVGAQPVSHVCTEVACHLSLQTARQLLVDRHTSHMHAAPCRQLDIDAAGMQLLLAA